MNATITMHTTLKLTLKFDVIDYYYLISLTIMNTLFCRLNTS